MDGKRWILAPITRTRRVHVSVFVQIPERGIPERAIRAAREMAWVAAGRGDCRSRDGTCPADSLETPERCARGAKLASLGDLGNTVCVCGSGPAFVVATRNPRGRAQLTAEHYCRRHGRFTEHEHCG